MKKVLVFMLSLLCALSCVLLVACNAKVTSIKIENAPAEVERGAEIDYSKINIVATLDDGTTETLPLTDKSVSYNRIDTSTIGAKTLTVRYSGKEDQTTITVVAGQVDVETVIITEYNNTDGYNEYLEAKKEQSNKQLEFYNRNELYKVGTANGYVFLPVVTAIDESENEVPIDKVDTTFKLYLKDDEDFTELTGDSLNTYLSNVEDNTYYFKAAAEHEVFKLEVTLADHYILIDEDIATTVTQVFEVVSGYNVYDVRGLSVLDNRNVKSWASLKEHKFAWDNGKKLSDFTDVEQVILHNNITITAGDLPSNYFWKEGDSASKEGSVSFDDALKRSPEDLRAYLAGSLKEVYLGEDWEEKSDIHQRGLFVSDGIGLSGNYLKIDYVANVNEQGEKGLYIVHDFNQVAGETLRTYPETHYSVVCYRHEGVDMSTIKGNHTIENVYFVGQTNKTEKTTIPAGLMMVSSNIDGLNINNVIGAKWFCNFTLDGVNTATLTVDGCKLYDSFSQMVYSYRSKEITITNSEMKGAGGPIMIITTRTGGGSAVTNTTVNIDSTANMESWLSGGEMWFTINNLPETDVEKLLGVASVTDGVVGTKYRNSENKINLIAVVIPNPDKVFFNQDKIEGTINIGDDTSYAMQNSVFSTLTGLNATAVDGEKLADDTLKLGSNDNVTALKNGFNQLAGATTSLPLAPIYQSGNAYGMGDGSTVFHLNTVGNLADNVKQLYYGSLQVAQSLNGLADQAEAGGNADQAAALHALAQQWEDLAANLAPVGTLNVDAATWSSSWTAGNMAVWINPGGLNASKPDFNIKHFMILLGEDVA